jgi:molybdopterin-guanine dinucleotide biosynthesis protein A
MGRDKAFLPLPDGRPLVARQAAVLREVPVADLLISARPHVDYGVSGVHRIYDCVPDAGPLAGLASAWGHTDQPHLLLLAVDLPHVTAEFLRALHAQAAPGVGVVPRGPRGFEPLCAVYPCDQHAGAAVRAALAAGRFSMQELLAAAVAEGWMRAFELSAAEQALLVNWNSPDDLSPAARG